MADDTTKLVISVETLLKNLDRTLRGLAQVEAQLKRVAAIKVGTQANTAGFNQSATAAQRLQVQQQRLANQQRAVEQTAQRLNLAQQRLATSAAKAAQATAQQAAGFRTVQQAAQQANVIFGLTNRQLSTIGNSFRSIGQGLASFGATLSVTLTAPLALLGTASVRAAVTLDSLKRGLTAIVGSSSEAATQLARLTQIAKLPGIGFEEAIQGSIRLQAVGFSALDAEKALKQFSNAVALTGGGRDELARITVQLGQLAAKGKVLSQDLRPIIEAAPAVGRALKQAFGTVNADDIADLTTNSREFLDVLVGELEKLPRAAAGARNSFENFRDTVFRAAAAVGEALLPPLVKLAEIVGPVITALAQGFAALSTPMKVALVGFAAFVAIGGPVMFIVGQLATGIGRVIVGLAQLNAQGLLPTIANLRLLSAAAVNANASLSSLRVASVAAGAGIIGLVVQLGLGLLAYAAFNSEQAKSTAATDEQLAATKEQIDSLKDQVKFLDSLKTGVARTAEEQDRLREIYNALNTEAQSRVVGINDEEQRLAALRAEIERLLQLRLRERELEIAGTVAQLANDAARKAALESEQQAISDQIARNRQLIESMENVDDASKQVVLTAEEQRAATQGTGQSVEDLILRNVVLTKSYNNIKEQLDGADGLTQQTKDLALKLRALGVVSADQIRLYLTLSKATGQFGLDVEANIPILLNYINVLDKTAEAAKRLKDLRVDERFFEEAGKNADELQKRRRTIISGAAATAREATDDFATALTRMRQFIAGSVELQQALRKQAQVEGKTIEEVIADALGGGRKDAGGALRNAQEQFADAMAKVTQEAAEKTIAEEKAKNDQLVRINELRFSRELASLREFIVEKGRLQGLEIEGEIRRQQEIVRLAKEDIKRAQARAGATTGVEQVKARTDEQKALAEQTQAETKILELKSRQRDIVVQVAQELDQSVRERERDFQELSRELDELAGREGDAARAALDERFTQRLRELRTELTAALRGFDVAAASGNAAAIVMAAATADQLKDQIATITNAKRQLGGLIEVREAQEEIRRAEQEQANLERQLAFDVEFRGKSEEEAIRQRLEGEAKVREVIDAQRVRLEVLMATLKAASLEIPLALSEAIESLKVDALGKGELPFVEQFRLAQKEFDKLNDARIQKIAEVERAVAHRDISELQGRIAIKLANGEYIGVLEQQLVILRQIAAQSGDIGLQRQATDAATVAAEVRNASTEVADFGTEIASVRIDALRDGFSQFLQDVARDADNAKEHLLNMLDSVLSRINQVIADRVSDKLIAALFGDGQLPSVAGGVGAGLGGQAAQGQAAAAALTTGATTASTALVTGATTASATIATGIATAAASFAGAVIAAGAAFAAAVAAGGAAQAVGGLGSALGGIGAATGMYPAVPGGMVHIVEGGYDEAVLTTDPKYAAQQVRILREYLARTKGLFGRLPQLAEGGMVSAQDMEANFLRSLSPRLSVPAPSSSLQLQSAATNFNLRNINLIDRGQMVSGHLRSAEGARDILNIISTERDEVGRRIGVRQ